LESLSPRSLFAASAALVVAAAACGGSNGSTSGADAGGLDATVSSDAAVPQEDASPLDAPLDDATPPPVGDPGPPDGGPVVDASITVDPTKPLGTIGPGFVGLSYEKSHLEDGYFTGTNAPLIALFQLLGPSLLRVGGNSVDESVWQAFDAGPPVGDAAAPSVITSADVDGLAAFAKAAGWKVLYGVNLKTSSAAAAEEEATYAAGALGTSLYGFEIGNEPDLYKAVASSPGTWNLAAFESDWKTFAAAIHAGVPGAPLTGPASAADYTSWTVPFAKDEAADIVLLTQHYYVANGQLATSTMNLLLAPNPGLATELKGLATAATANGIAGGYRLSECNSFYNGGAPGVSDGYGTALWVIDFLFANGAATAPATPPSPTRTPPSSARAPSTTACSSSRRPGRGASTRPPAPSRRPTSAPTPSALRARRRAWFCRTRTRRPPCGPPWMSALRSRRPRPRASRARP
jgi:hypothetical protein